MRRTIYYLLRVGRDMSQKEIASAMGVTPVLISSIEMGDRKMTEPRLELFLRHIGITMDEFNALLPRVEAAKDFSHALLAVMELFCGIDINESQTADDAFRVVPIAELKQLRYGDVIFITKGNRERFQCMLLPYQHPDHLNVFTSNSYGTRGVTVELPYKTMGREWTAEVPEAPAN